MSDREPNSREAGASRLYLVNGAFGRDPEAREPAAASQASKSAGAVVSFDRRELRVIFDVYGNKVANGEWRDYALDFTASKAVFSVFRRACETPFYRIEKNPTLGRRQGAYSVVDASGLILRRGHDLARVVGVLDRKLRLASAPNRRSRRKGPALAGPSVVQAVGLGSRASISRRPGRHLRSPKR